MFDLLQWTRLGDKSQKWGLGQIQAFFPGFDSQLCRGRMNFRLWGSCSCGSLARRSCFCRREWFLLSRTAAFSSPSMLHGSDHCSIHSRVACFLQYLSRWLIHNRWGGCVCIHSEICAVQFPYVQWSDTGLLGSVHGLVSLEGRGTLGHTEMGEATWRWRQRREGGSHKPRTPRALQKVKSCDGLSPSCPRRSVSMRTPWFLTFALQKQGVIHLLF